MATTIAKLLGERMDSLAVRAINRATHGGYAKYREALADAEINLTMDDAGWGLFGSAAPFVVNDMPMPERAMLVRRARRYYLRDPMCHHAVRLYTSYSIGRGLSIKASGPNPVKGQDNAKDPHLDKLQAIADNFWEHPDNDVVFSTQGQHLASDKLNIDGEIFYMLFPGEDVTRVRLLMDSLTVEQVITNPEDTSEHWYYLRRWTDQVGGRHEMVYPALALRYMDDPPLFDDTLRAAFKVSASTKVSDSCYVYHRAINTAGIRGYSLLTAALDWAKVHREYLEDRATISRAHARLAWVRKVKGPLAAVQGFVAGDASKNVLGSQQPVQPAGGILTANEGSDWSPMNAQGGGANAYTESRTFKLMFCIAVGIPEHYFADGSNGTRATSKSMERPVLQMFTDYQTIWKKTIEKLFAFELFERGEKYDAHVVRVDAPKILEDDTKEVVDSIVSLIGVLPQFDIDEIKLLILNALSVDDPQDVLPKLHAREDELQAEYERNIALLTAANAAGIDLNIEDLPSTDPTKRAGIKRGPQFGVGTPTSTLVTRKPHPSGFRPADDPLKQ